MEEWRAVYIERCTYGSVRSVRKPAAVLQQGAGCLLNSIYRFRLAEPNLFLGKYNRFTPEGQNSGLRIDLNKNFRSRREILDGTNFLFRQLMGVKVGEMEYNSDAELKLGASYPEDKPYPLELYLIDSKGESSSTEGEGAAEEEGLEQAQLEARLVAGLIKEAVSTGKRVYDTKQGIYRPCTYRDMVVLMRSMAWTPQMMEEFKKQGIPVYASLSTGYFEANEVRIMISLLKIIDNPQQDIPFAAVLRSPIAGLDEEEMAKIRLFNRDSYFEALESFYRGADPAEYPGLYEKAAVFYRNLNRWRDLAKQTALSDLIWQLYGDTNFYDFAGGMPGGKQRQANLQALYDRARQYEASSFRGLFRFLRFIEKMEERGDDLGAARALGEQEDVVKIMTIHSSKGLEFPIVFLAGLGRRFNRRDLMKPYLLDKEYGFASRFVDPDLRITFPSLPQIAFKKKQQLESTSEEMRVLYVALTRAKEKLYLTGSLKDAGKSLAEWAGSAAHQDWLLKDHTRANAKTYLDWIGPALMRHSSSMDLQREYGIYLRKADDLAEDVSDWKIRVVQPADLQLAEAEEVTQEELLNAVKQGEKTPIESPFKEQIISQLHWEDPNRDAAERRSKQSVSELKRQREILDDSSSTELLRKFKRPITNRPQFMQEKSMTPAEKGTAAHMIMQHVPLKQPVTIETLRALADELVMRELLTEEQKQSVDLDNILAFFDLPIGRKLQQADRVRREVPFTMNLPAAEVYADWTGAEEDVLVQGVIDCLFEDEDGLFLLDYKTDAIQSRFVRGFEGAKDILAGRYRMQIDLYTRAVENILKKPTAGRYLYFFDGGHLLEM